MKKINKYQFGGNIDFSKLFEGNPLLSGYINKANDFATKFTPSLTPSITTSILGEKPTKMDGNQFAISKGFDLKNNPFAIFKKGFGKLGKQYKEYNNQYNTDINNYNTQTTTLGNSMGPLLGSLSMLIQGMQGEKNYQSSNNDFIDDYQEGGSVEDLMNQDEFLKARGAIESSMNQDSVSSAGAVGMFQITPIALKEYNRKYDSKYTWDQVKSNAVANAHVSNGLIKDIRSMINKIDTNLSDFDKNILAEMAYNYGPYRFMDKLKAKGKNVTLQDMLNEKSLPTETRNHGKKFIDYFDKNRQLADKKVLAPRDNTRVVNTLPELKTFKGDPYEYKKEGTQYYFRKNGGEFKPINEAGKRELQRRKFQFGGTLSEMFSNQNMLKNLAILINSESDNNKKKKALKDIESLNFVNNISKLFNNNNQSYNIPYNTYNNIPSTENLTPADNSSIEIGLPSMEVIPDEIPKNINPSSIVSEIPRSVQKTNPLNNTINTLSYNRDLPKLNPNVATKNKTNSNISKEILYFNNKPNIDLDYNKVFVAAESDPTLLHSNIKRVYSKENNTQVGYLNEEGQFLPTGSKRLLKFEGKPSKFNGSIPDSLLKKIIQYQMGGTTLPQVNIKGESNKIFVNSKNDPRYKMYRDSMNLYLNSIRKDKDLYNKFKNTINNINYGQKSDGGTFTEEKWNSPEYKEYRDIIEKEYKNRIGNVNVFNKKTSSNEDLLTNANTINKNIKPYLNKSYGSFNLNSINGQGFPSFQNTDMYKKPTTPVEVYQNQNILPLDNSIQNLKYNRVLPNINLKQPYIPNNEMIRPFENMPNINIVYTRDSPLGSWTPKEYQNSIGDRIPYNQQLTRQFQYPQQKQMGGNVNTTGYTPGTPTMNNDHNIIPSNQITMENTPFPVNAYPMNNGQLIGKPVKMKPGLNYYFPNANSVLEIPEKQSGGLISTEDGFSKRKGESRWGYKDNGDGTYSAIDYTRNGKQFLLSDPNNKAYKAVAALFPKSISQPTVNNNSNISTQSPARESSYISQYVQDNQLQTVPEPVQNVSLSQLPQGYNPYSYSGQPQTISQEQLNQNIPISYFDKNTALSGALATGLTIAPMGKVLSPLLGKLTSLFTSKKYVSPNNYKKLVDNIFDGVKKEVKEIPGRASRAKSKSYNEGVQKVFSGRNPVYEKYGGYISKYQYGGEAQEPELVPIQTEKGEKIYHLDGSISNVGAKKLHKNMDNDEITDVVLSGSFIASRDPQMKISKKEASNIILGNHAVKYEQGKPVKPPKDIKFSDIFKKRYHTPAQLTDIIDKKFKISDKPNNIFTKQANEWNKESRDQYMNIVKYMTEVKKPAESNQYKYGGKVEKHQLGGIISGALQLIPQVANMFTQNANKNATLSDISKYETQNRGYLQNQIGIGGLSNLLGYATQDLTPEIYDPSQVLNELSRPYNQALSSIPYRQNQNLSQSRAASNNAYSRLANIDPRLAYASASTIGSNGLRDANQINSQLDAYRDNLSTQLGQQRSSIVRDSLLNRQQTLANTRSNRNLLNSGLFSNFAQLGNDYYGGLSNINNTGLAARMGARGQYANFLTNMNYGMGNSLSQIANGISGLGKSTSAPAPTPYNFNTVNNSIRNYRANYNRQEFQDVHDSYPFLNQSPLSYLAPIKR